MRGTWERRRRRRPEESSERWAPSQGRTRSRRRRGMAQRVLLASISWSWAPRLRCRTGSTCVHGAGHMEGQRVRVLAVRQRHVQCHEGRMAQLAGRASRRGGLPPAPHLLLLLAQMRRDALPHRQGLPAQLLDLVPRVPSPPPRVHERLPDHLARPVERLGVARVVLLRARLPRQGRPCFLQSGQHDVVLGLAVVQVDLPQQPVALGEALRGQRGAGGGGMARRDG